MFYAQCYFVLLCLVKGQQLSLPVMSVNHSPYCTNPNFPYGPSASNHAVFSRSYTPVVDDGLLYLYFFCSPLRIIILHSLHTNLYSPLELSDGSDLAAHYHDLSSESGGFICDSVLGWSRSEGCLIPSLQCAKRLVCMTGNAEQ
jgi:hypothetical protein